MNPFSTIGRWIVLLSLATAMAYASGAEDLRVEVVDLNHRTAKEIIPIIARIADPSVRLSGFGMKVIIKANSTQISETRQIIDEFDVELRNLVLRFLLRSEDNDVGGAGSGSVTVVLGGRSVLDPRQPVAKGEKRIVASSEGLAEERDTIETIRVLEGTPAYIRIGETRVLRSNRQWSETYMPRVRVGVSGGRVRTDVLAWPGANSAEPLLLRNTGIELAVVAAPLGDTRVRIEITRLSANEKTADPLAVPTTRAQTVITGELGQWITIGTLTHTSVSRVGQGRLDTAGTGQASRLLRIRADLGE